MVLSRLLAIEIDTPFGCLGMVIEDFYMSGRINEVVTINRVDYGIEVVVSFLSHLEDWQIIAHVYRAIPAGFGLYKAYEKNGQPYARTQHNDMATTSAQKHVNALLKPCLTQWIDQNAGMIIQAQSVSKQRTAERALGIVKMFKERAERALQQMITIEAKTKNHEPLTEKEQRTLNDVLENRYWLW